MDETKRKREEVHVSVLGKKRKHFFFCLSKPDLFSPPERQYVRNSLSINVKH